MVTAPAVSIECDVPASVADNVPVTLIAAHVHALLDAAPVSLPYHQAIVAVLSQPGNILSATPDARWARLVATCCRAAGGTATAAIPAAAAAEMFMTALDLLDDAEDGERNPVCVAYGAAAALNVSTGLLFLAQRTLLDTPAGARAVALLLDAGLCACSGQHEDLCPALPDGDVWQTALSITARKSAGLTALLCRLGAFCADRDVPCQEVYARFGWYLGMARQLVDDIADLMPEATAATDLALQRPTLPLIYALQMNPGRPFGDTPGVRAMLWEEGAAYLTWAVAEGYRRRALNLAATLPANTQARTALAALLPIL